ncbi:MAG: hypothetical protein JJU05_15435 [Verrucomicrobia bacterium]|nr:hypothetical protein [Verrucomicrobiota bacterium]MCH8527419.1 hypothetical protein [Kiritimatiellia bacterium]
MKKLLVYFLMMWAALACAVVPQGSVLTARPGESLRLLNPMLSAGDIPNTGAWRMTRARAVPVADPAPKLGSHALRFEGESQINSGKGDFVLVSGLRGELTAVGLWVHTVDALVGRARLPEAERTLRAVLHGAPDVEPGEALQAAVLLENPTNAPRRLHVTYRLGSNPEWIEPDIPHPVHGLNRVGGCTSWVVVNGERIDDGSLTDGSPFTGLDRRINDPGYTEAFHYVDLGASRRITHLQYRAGDANWIWNLDIAASQDGESFAPVPGLQNLDLHKKWGEQNLSVPTPFKARFIRLRYHKQGESLNFLRLPQQLRVFEGVRDEDFAFAELGPALREGTLELEVPAGAFVWAALPVVKIDPGAYLMEARVEGDGFRQILSRSHFTLPRILETLPDDSRFGMNASSFDFFDINRRLGVGWIRFENMKWQMFSNAPDHFAFDGSIAPWHVRHDVFVEEYHKRGMQVLPYTFQVPAWSTSAPADVTRNRHSWPPNDYADYGEAIYQLAARYGSRAVPEDTLRTPDKTTGLGQISVFQLWNEPNLVGPTWAPWVGSMAQYYELFRQGAEGVKRADPGARVAHAGYAGIGVSLVNELRTHTYADGKTPLDFTDLITVHYYSGRQDPEVATRDPNANRSGRPIEGMPTFPERIRELTDWRNRHAPDKEVWITETGYDVGGPIGLGEREQAMKLPRVTLLLLAAGVDKVFIYRESGSTESMHAGAGLARNDHSLRPAYFTYATLIREFEGVGPGRALRLLTDNPDVWVYLWQRNGKPLLTAWTVTGTAELDFGAGEVTDSFSAKTTVAAGERVTLTPFPRYVALETLPAEWQRRAEAAQAREAARQARMARDQERQVYLFDFGGREFVGTLTLGDVRTFTPVLHDDLYDADKGHGFQPAAMLNEDKHWIPGPLNRDSVRFRNGQTFRFNVDPGRYRLELSAAPMGERETLTLNVDGEQIAIHVVPDTPREATTIGLEIELAEAQTLILGVEGMAHIHWLTLVEVE